MKTLEQLVKELNLKPHEAELDMGRCKSKNGYSLVLINKDNEYITVYPDHTFLISSTDITAKVRG